MRTIAATRFQRGLTDRQTIALLIALVGVAAAVVFRVRARWAVAPEQMSEVFRMKQVGLALLMYQSDYDNKFPPDMASKSAIQRETTDYSKDKVIFETQNPNGGEITGDRLLGGRNAKDLKTPELTPMVFDSKSWPDNKVAICFADGHAKWQPSDLLGQELAAAPLAKSSESKSQ